MSTFYYSTLQYRHSIALGEQLNVAVLVLFPEVPEVRFLFPDQLRRLSLAYPGTPEGIVKKYLASMAKRVVTLNRNPELFASYDLVHQPEVFLASEFLQADDSALQFGPFRSGVLYDTLEKVAQSLYHLLLSHYKEQQFRIRLKQNAETGAFDPGTAELIEFIDYEDTGESFDEYLERLIRQAAPSWADVADPDAWLREIRGYEED